MFKNKERNLIVLVIGLLVFGLVMVYSSSWPYAVNLGLDPEYFLKNQARAAIIGLILMGIFSFVPYRLYKKLALPLYLGAYVLCLLLFTPLGDTYGTFARRWLNLGPISFMPSDLLKFAAIVALAAYLSSRKKKLKFSQDFIPVMAFIAISILPVYLQPNLSTVILMVMVLFAMYFLYGMDLKYFLFIIPMAITAGLIFLTGEKNAYRRERLRSMFNPLEDYHGAGWQLSQALFAVSSGGFFGLGLGQSRQKHLYLSEAHNDFIFAIIAEELGLFACIILIICFLTLLIIGFSIAGSTRDDFARLLASGITLLISFQAVINMAVAVGISPPTGLVLPFISYGGTSLIINLAMIGILVNIGKTTRRPR